MAVHEYSTYCPSMNEKAKALYEEAITIRYKLGTGILSYAEAIEALKPYETYYNTTNERIANEFGVNGKKFNPKAFLR